MPAYPPSGAALPAWPWRRSSHSTGANNCVETATVGEHLLAVRDSKNPTGPFLLFRASAWSAFLDGVRGGVFDPPGCP